MDKEIVIVFFRTESGDNTADVALTPTDAAPAGGVILASGDAKTNGTMGGESSKPAVSVTKIQPIINGDSKPPGQKTGNLFI